MIINTIRGKTIFQENIETKYVYHHPNYTYPSHNDDLALIELGRRIHFDYGKVGSSHKSLNSFTVETRKYFM